ncbi:hypothetical protein JTB14_035548 [Gonioctena quinquepunctata]|nr:hypothetical protein JTB14_035548 [Gonioctena quinquepunctata]
MPNLGDISKIGKNISSSSLKAVNALHVVAFGNEGEGRKTRKEMRDFSGFHLDKKFSEFAKSENDLQSHGENEKTYDGEVEEESEEEVDSDENKNGNDRGAKSGESFGNTKLKGSFSLTFKDVEDSIRTFDGKDNYPARKWIEDFEEISELTGWNDLQKLIFAKKSLKGLAKLFIQSEKGITKWVILEKKLIAEFEVKVSSAQIHILLMARKKWREESVQEYVLIMREIGSRANIESGVLIQYIIDGIQDDTSNKLVMYGAKTFGEFKEKVKLNEQIAISRTKPGQERNKEGKHMKERTIETKKDKDEKRHRKTSMRLCFNCGDKGHLFNECPDKAKGPKCFVCSGYGHVSTKCPEKNNRSGSSNMTLVEVAPRNSVKLNIDDIQMIALLDTGSDITAIRQDVYEAYFKDIDLNGESVTLRGIGSNRVATMGFFERNVSINEEELVLKIHVIPCETSNFKAIVGNDILAQVDVVFRDGEIVVFEKERHNFLWTITLDEEANKETEIVDVINIKNEENRKEVKKLIEEYHPEKIMDADVEMKIILKNEESIYQSPRRLAITEKEERFVSTIFRKLLVENIMLYYMDDMVILSSTEEEGLERLRRVFQAAKDYGLDIKKKKCQLLKTKIEFLGFIIDDGRVQPSNDRTLAIKNYPEPTTLKQIQYFLGLTRYFRKFISSYSVIAKPLSNLLRKEQRFVFGYEQKEAFEKLKKFLSCKPVLHIYKQGGETELHTDASKYGYGACLLQTSNEDGRFQDYN